VEYMKVQNTRESVEKKENDNIRHLNPAFQIRNSEILHIF